ncbi:MAG: SDR family oxidoreductase [Verrucomicrobia bacterium]|nr:SDR family oxidoreductase [Verrucomicrobiota bacterium]
MAHDIFSLSGRSALVTGGSRGLGEAIARAFVQYGADVVIASRQEESLKSTASRLQTEGTGRVAFVPADLTRREDVARLAHLAREAFGKIDILVNNAGSHHAQAVTDIVQRDWDELLELNLTSCMMLTRALAGEMKERGWGRIINVSSVLGLASRRKCAAYSVSKAALIGFTRASAIDLGPFGITVNCLAPGPFNVRAPDATPTDRQRENFTRWTALGRWGRPDELAGPALLLASDAGSYTTGTVIAVDGGALASTLA